MKGKAEQALSVGWHSEMFTRTKRLKPLAGYLKPEPTVTDKRAKGANDVRRLFERLANQGDVPSL